MLRTAEDDEEHVCLDFSETDRRRGSDYDNFGVSHSFNSSMKENLTDVRSGVSDSRQTVKRWSLGVVKAV
jgi:hypothetical protein